jgi:hypothetical protein
MDFYDLVNVHTSLMEANRQSLIDTFAWVANRYKDNPYAVFGVINEPMIHNPLIENASSTTQMRLATGYSQLIGQVIAGIRNTGAQNLVIADVPYAMPFQYTVKLNRNDFVWENHAYIARDWGGHTYASWQAELDAQINYFNNVLQQPLFYGEYSVFPQETYNGVNDPYNFASYWKTWTQQMVQYFNGHNVVGRNWHAYSSLLGEYYDSPLGPASEQGGLTQADMDFILATTLG